MSNSGSASAAKKRPRRSSRPQPAGTDAHPADHPLTDLAEEDKIVSWRDEKTDLKEELLKDRPPHWDTV